MKELKNAIEETVEVNQTLFEKSKTMNELLMKEFSCSLTIGQAIAVLSSEHHKCNIWFMRNYDLITQKACTKFPESEEEIKIMVDSKANIINARSLLIELFDMKGKK